MGAELVEFLAERDEPCPSCGYNLRGLTEPACSECGVGLALRVNIAKPRLASFLGGVIALSVGAGFHVPVYVYALTLSVTGGGVSHRDPEVITLVVGGLGSMTGLIVWIRRWRRLRETAGVLRWALVGIASVFSVGTALLFFYWAN